MPFPIILENPSYENAKALAMVPQAEPYTNIKAMVVNYFSCMKAISSYLTPIMGAPKLDITNEPIGFYLTNVELDRIRNTIGMLPEFNKYACLFGIESTTGHLTVSIVGAKADGNILDVYKDNPTTEGEETWPKCIFTMSSNSVALARFLEVK